MKFLVKDIGFDFDEFGDGNPEWHEAKKPGQPEHCTQHNHFHRAPAAGPVEARRQVQALSVVAAEVA